MVAYLVHTHTRGTMHATSSLQSRARAEVRTFVHLAMNPPAGRGGRGGGAYERAIVCVCGGGGGGMWGGGGGGEGKKGGRRGGEGGRTAPLNRLPGYKVDRAFKAELKTLKSVLLTWSAGSKGRTRGSIAELRTRRRRILPLIRPAPSPPLFSLPQKMRPFSHRVRAASLT